MWKPYSEIPGEKVLLVCVYTGIDFESQRLMWSKYKIYEGIVSGPACGIIEIQDDFGNTRILTNTGRPTFPMGTDRHGLKIFTARFERI